MLKKRGERFGCSVSSLMEKVNDFCINHLGVLNFNIYYMLSSFATGCILIADLFQAELAERLEKRKARFGEVNPIENKVPYNKVKIVK